VVTVEKRGGLPARFGQRDLDVVFDRPPSWQELTLTAWKEIVGPEDTVLHLGDVAGSSIRKGLLPLLAGLPGRVILVPGNWDSETHLAVFRDLRWQLKRGLLIRLYRGWIVFFTHEPLDLGELEAIGQGGRVPSTSTDTCMGGQTSRRSTSTSAWNALTTSQGFWRRSSIRVSIVCLRPHGDRNQEGVTRPSRRVKRHRGVATDRLAGPVRPATRGRRLRLEIADDGTIKVTLSRRNLLALLAKLSGSPERSHCSIGWDRLVVHAEPDAEHYGGRVAPGAMHPMTEATIKYLEDRE
jgi:hypothetical protein